jgi:hypothetical protein
MRKAVGKSLLDAATHSRTHPRSLASHDFDLAMDKMAIAFALEKRVVVELGARGEKLVVLDPAGDATLEDTADRTRASDVIPTDFSVDGRGIDRWVDGCD